MANKETPQETIDRLTAELAAANKIIDSFQAEKKEQTEIEKLIAAKMAVGLTRGQAISVITHQNAHDKFEADQAAKKAAKEKEAKDKAAEAAEKK